jgi:hypothetical protein
MIGGSQEVKANKAYASTVNKTVLPEYIELPRQDKHNCADSINAFVQSLKMTNEDPRDVEASQV